MDPHAENTIIVVPGANAALTALTAAQRAVVASARVLLTQLEIPIPLVQDAAATRPAGSWHLLNAAPSGPFVEAGSALLPTVDVLIVNEHEALEVAGADDLESAVAALAPLVRALVVTLGRHGSLIACGDERADVAAFSAEAVDTTGAGDTFCGMFAAVLAASGRAPESVDVALLAEAARAGAAAAALAVTRPGAQDAVPTAAEVAALLEGATA